MRCVALVFALWLSPVHADEIKVLAGSAVDPALAVLIPQFQRASGHKVAYDPDGAVGAMAKRIQDGEIADVLIVSLPQIRSLEVRGKVVAGSATQIGRMGAGVFVRKGAPKPDISSVEAFKQTMLAAQSIGYNDPAAGAPVGVYLVELFKRMGIAAEMHKKTRVFKERSERFAPIARGEVEIGFNQISEILVAPGVELVGPLPAPIQHYTEFGAALVTSGRSRDAGQRFIDFITSPAARAVFRAKGFE